jgi:uncharacterized protein YeaO (DUF488 family)
MGTVEVVRVYDAADPSGRRVLVDRLWPRGLRKEGAPFAEWAKDVAPSTGLRTWYGHRPERFAEFARRYRDELQAEPAASALAALRSAAAHGRLVLVTATKDVEHSAAAVLRDVLAPAE